ncbi:hypothetical protein NL676_018731 [Syzygium grande]|nr:hypothetical protein NL676_018731 [Syzygium grande]
MAVNNEHFEALKVRNEWVAQNLGVPMPPLGPALDKLQGAEHGLGWACGSSRSVNQCTSRSLSGELNVQRKDKLAEEKELQADMQEQVATHEISSDHQGAGNVVQDLHGTASRSDAAATRDRVWCRQHHEEVRKSSTVQVISDKRDERMEGDIHSEEVGNGTEQVFAMP